VKRLLIVSPHFPPVNAPDMHRVRMSLPFFEQFGWKAGVLAVDPEFDEGVHEAALVDSLPPGLSVTRVRALPLGLTRRVGVGNLALRALPYLHAAGARILASEPHDLVYFSTTMFPAMALGRGWRRKFGVPYVVDMQDPWYSTYYDEHPGAPRPPKYWAAHRLDSVLEPWTMRRVGGIVSVSGAYVETLRARYPWIDPACCVTLPFGASERDFEMLDRLNVENRVFEPRDGFVHGVCAGRVNQAMTMPVRVVLGALEDGSRRLPDLYGRVRLHFVGTDYATGDRARKTVEPIATELGVGAQVTEQTSRVGYFEALRLIRDADFLLVLGSDDPQYTASKVFPYVLARKPILAVLHEQSGAAPLLRALRPGPVVTYGGGDGVDAARATLQPECDRLMQRLATPPPSEPDTDWTQFAPFHAREITRRQCELFDKVTSRGTLRH